MISFIDNIKIYFSEIMSGGDSVKLVTIYNLGYLCIIKSKYGFLIGISFESRDRLFGASIDFDESKFEKSPKYLKIQLDSKEFFTIQKKYVNKKLGMFYFIKKNYDEYVIANIEFYAEYFKNNHQMICEQYYK